MPRVVTDEEKKAGQHRPAKLTATLARVDNRLLDMAKKAEQEHTRWQKLAQEARERGDHAGAEQAERNAERYEQLGGRIRFGPHGFHNESNLAGLRDVWGKLPRGKEGERESAHEVEKAARLARPVVVAEEVERIVVQDEAGHFDEAAVFSNRRVLLRKSGDHRDFEKLLAKARVQGYYRTINGKRFYIGDFAGIGEPELAECLGLIYAGQDEQELARKIYDAASYKALYYTTFPGAANQLDPQPLAYTLAVAHMALQRIPLYATPLQRKEQMRAIGQYVRDNLDASFDQRVHESATEPLSLGDNLRLALAWDTTCRVVADVGGVEMAHVGFVCQSLEAAMMQGIDRLGECEGDGRYAKIRCNPYALPQTTANVFARELWLLATHEVTHAKGYGAHNQEFISAEEDIEKSAFDVLRPLEHLVGTLAAHREARGVKRTSNTAKRYREAKSPELGTTFSIPPAGIRKIREDGIKDTNGRLLIPPAVLDDIYWSWEQIGKPDISGGGFYPIEGVLEATEHDSRRHYTTSGLLQTLHAHEGADYLPVLDKAGKQTTAYFGGDYLQAVLTGMYAMYLRERLGRKPIPAALVPA